jgi:hypothetical protein
MYGTGEDLGAEFLDFGELAFVEGADTVFFLEVGGDYGDPAGGGEGITEFLPRGMPIKGHPPGRGIRRGGVWGTPPS